MSEKNPKPSPIRQPGAKSKQKAAGGEESGRMKGMTIVKPLVYGNISWQLGSKMKNDEGHTHQWHLYLRSYDNEDLSVYVKRVQFKLHESYSEPIRVITSPPFDISETGWGEFEIAIKIFFQDSSERPATVCHFLKLFERDEQGNVKVAQGPVTSESYDELVFVDPTIKMYKLLTQPKPAFTVAPSHNQDYEKKKVEDLNKILEAKEKVKQEIEDLKKKLSSTRDDVEKLKKKISDK